MNACKKIREVLYYLIRIKIIMKWRYYDDWNNEGNDNWRNSKKKS